METVQPAPCGEAGGTLADGYEAAVDVDGG